MPAYLASIPEGLGVRCLPDNGITLPDGSSEEKFDDVSIIPTFVLTPLTYLGGVFYSIKLLPPFWEGVSRANPIVYMVNAFRYGILQGHLKPEYIDINIYTAFAVIALFIVFLFSLALWMLNRGIGLRQ